MNLKKLLRIFVHKKMNNREKLEREYFASDMKRCFEDWLIVELMRTRAAKIKERRKTVRAKRPAQQRKYKIRVRYSKHGVEIY